MKAIEKAGAATAERAMSAPKRLFAAICALLLAAMLVPTVGTQQAQAAEGEAAASSQENAVVSVTRNTSSVEMSMIGSCPVCGEPHGYMFYLHEGTDYTLTSSDPSTPVPEYSFGRVNESSVAEAYSASFDDSGVSALGLLPKKLGSDTITVQIGAPGGTS